MSKEKLRFAILKEINAGNTPLIKEDFQVTEDEFGEAVRYLTSESYLVGIQYAEDGPIINKIGPSLTRSGEEFLRDNSAFAKTYKGLKEIREWF